MKLWVKGSYAASEAKWTQIDVGHITTRWNTTAVQYKCDVPEHFEKFLTAVNRFSDVSRRVAAAHPSADPLLHDCEFIRDPVEE